MSHVSRKHLLKSVSFACAARRFHGSHGDAASVYAQPAAMPQGPVAYVDHGAMFDRDDNELTLTAEFIWRTQDFYLRQLLNCAD